MPTLRPKGTAFEKRKAVREGDPGAAHLDKMLDEALRETFPASDPVAITIETPLKAVALDGYGTRTITNITAHRSIRPPLRRTGGSANSDSPERQYPAEAGLPHLPSPPKAS
jgi:phage terminase large subunit GpA-like protein